MDLADERRRAEIESKSSIKLSFIGGDVLYYLLFM
jgi:hypothetical protein